MPRVFLIRHGESCANAGMPANTSVSDIYLTDNGHAQARNLAESLTLKPDLVITSPFLRTKQTAAPLLEKFPGLLVEEWPIYEFTYLNADKCKGTTVDERRVLTREYWLRNDPNWRDGPGCDTFNEFVQRSLNMLTRLKDLKAKNVYVFTHSLFMALTEHICLNDDWSDVTKDLSKDKERMDYFHDVIKKRFIANTEVIELHL